MLKELNLLNFIEKEKLEEILQALTQATGVSSIITEVNGKPITSPSNFTSLCSNYCRFTKEGEKKCQQSDHYGGQESAITRKVVIYDCFNAGLLDCAAPIIVEGYHIATFLFGQVLEKPMERSKAIQRARSIGIKDIDGFLKELETVPLMSREQLKKIAKLMEVVTRTISDLALQKYIAYKRSRRYLNKLINSVSDCIVAMDTSFTITMVNEAGALMVGREKKEMIGKSVWSIFSDKFNREFFQEQMSEEKEHYRGILEAVDTNSRVFPVQMALSAIRSNDENDGFVAVLRDISDEKKMEQMKEDLVGMLTHDIGLPIASVQSALRLIVDKNLGELNETQSQLLGLVLGTVNQLNGIGTDFHDVYKSENGQFILRKQSIDIRSLLTESINLVSLFAIDKKVEINFHHGKNIPELKGDYSRILRTCVNLLDNAVKYSPEGGKIDIAFKVLSAKTEQIPQKIVKNLQQGAQYCLISIQDYGPGIPKKYQAEIFNKFFRVENKLGIDEVRKGTGLGLAFCKLVVYAHNGHLWIKSPLMEGEGCRISGCCFNIILPLY